ncbi:MAG: pirin family protein [Chitinophagaceae bacterium]|nr:pirin family protein [Chitinophagaceae bacterium]
MKRRTFIKGSAIIGLSASVPLLLRGGSGLFETATGRKVYRILNADKTLVGTLPVLRVFAGDHDDYISPYVFFDEFGPVTVKANDQPLRVNAHPHAGIIPTTYFLAGTGHHKDSLNYDFQIGKGDFMMFCSGRGAIHMEETGKQLYEQGGLYHGFQIWLNLPAKYKFIAPATDVHRIDQMGWIEKKDYSARVVLGELFGAKSSVELLSPAFYFHIKMKAGCKLEIPVDATHNAFAYVVSGNLETEGRKQINTNQVALYERGDNRINLFAVNGAEILVAGGKPLNEPVYSYGPFVMNTEEEIQRCIRDYQAGKMGNPEVVNK